MAKDCGKMNWLWPLLSPKLAFLLVSFCLGELGDGLNIFQGIYLVGIGWNEGAVGAALSLMGLTALLVQPVAGDWIDKATVDRRIFLILASVVTACSASTILFVRSGNADHLMIYCSKIIEGVASSFIGPCLAALSLASFGPNQFDSAMASNIFWGHIGSVASAVSAGIVAYASFPDIKFCFLVIGASALIAIIFIQYLPQGDPLMGRGFQGHRITERDIDFQQLHSVASGDTTLASETTKLNECDSSDGSVDPDTCDKSQGMQTASSYWEVFTDHKTCILCCTGFFFHFANANVLLVLAELMGRDSDDNDGSASRTAIPLTAIAIITAQITMAMATWAGGSLTEMGIGRKPLFIAGILSLPIRCVLIILLKDAGHAYLLATQVLDGVSGGLLGLVQPYIVADITFGTGRFNVIMGLTASSFGLGATLSNFLGQLVVEHFGHVASLLGSLVLSIIPIILFCNMPETYGCRGTGKHYKYKPKKNQKEDIGYNTFSA